MGGKMFDIDCPVGVIEALAYIAWSDQRIAPEERMQLEGLAAALEVDEAGAAAVQQALAARPSLESIAAKLTDPVEARFAVTQAILLALADGEYSSIERRDVVALAAALNIPGDDLRAMEAEVEAAYLAPRGT